MSYIDLTELLLDALDPADCTRRRVGAAVIKGGDVLSKGWNALPDGSCTAGACPRGRLSPDVLPPGSSYSGNCVALHAEVRALRAAGESARGATLVVSSPPCQWCAEAAEAAGVAHVLVVDFGSMLLPTIGPL